MKGVKVLIWLGFISLLATSVSKVAWVFRAFEGSPLVLWGWLDVLWIIPLLVALCIDALILALTYAISHDKKRTSQWSMVAFIALLCGISVYSNLLYNAAHTPTGSIWSNTLVASITPFIVACVPLFALCYTLVLSRLTSTQGETLEEKATRLENEKVAKERIRDAKKGMLKTRIMDTITDAKDVASHTFKREDKPAKDEGQNAGTNETDGQAKPDDNLESNKVIRQDKTEVNSAESEIQTSPQIALTPDMLPILDAFPLLRSWLAAGHKTMTKEAVAEALQVSVRLVVNRVKDGTIKCSSRNRELLLITSVIDWQKSHVAASQNGSKLRDLHPVKLVQNGYKEESETESLVDLEVAQ